MSHDGKRRRMEDKRIDKKATNIVETMPELPKPDDSSATTEQKVSAYRSWLETARERVEGKDNLAQRVLEKMRKRMGIDENSPGADLQALNLIEAGMGDVGLTNKASAALDESGIDRQKACDYLAGKYAQARREHGVDLLVTRNNDTADLLVGLQDALRVNIWLDGEANMPTVSSYPTESYRIIGEGTAVDLRQLESPDQEDDSDS